MKIRLPAFKTIYRYGGFLFFAALLALFVFRYQTAFETIAPKGPGVYHLKLISKEKIQRPAYLKYRLGFQCLVNRKVRLFATSADSLFGDLWPGQLLIVQGNWKALPQKHSLQSFDYGRYLFLQGYKGLLKIERIVNHKGANSNKTKVPYRERLLQKIDAWPWDETNKAILKALLVGYKAGLSPQIKKEFSEAGAMHLLALSGLHVGILYLLLSSFLKITRLGRKTWLEFVLVQTALWSFAFLGGASPSVLRAVSMFSFLALAKLSRRPQNSLRALLLSALLWIWINPLLLHAPGFQLSYLAVLGILLFVPRLEALFSTRHLVLKGLLQLNYLSIAAQAFTWPLSAYYFGQFPLYFWLSSLLLMPLIALIMYGGLIAILLDSMVSWSAVYLSYYEQLFEALKTIITWIHKLPWSSLAIPMSGIYLFFFLLLPIGITLKKPWKLPYIGSLILTLGIYRISFRYIEPDVELKDHGPYPRLKELRMEEQRYFFYRESKEQSPEEMNYLDKIDAQCILLPMSEPYADSLILWNLDGLRIAPKKAP